MALSPDQIAQQIADLGRDLPQSVASAVQEAADIAIEQVKANLVTSQYATGALRSSIEAIVDEATLTLGVRMNEYGYYQNFGVAGTDNKATLSTDGLDEATASAFNVSPGYQFKFSKDNKMIGGDLPFGVRVKIHKDGLNAKDFLDIEAFTQQVADLVQENLEL